MSRVHFDSRLNSVEVDGFFADNDGNYYFNQIGIEPTQVIEFEVGEGLDMIGFINDFYNHPGRYTNMLMQNEEQTL